MPTITYLGTYKNIRLMLLEPNYLCANLLRYYDGEKKYESCLLRGT